MAAVIVVIAKCIFIDDAKSGLSGHENEQCIIFYVYNIIKQMYNIFTCIKCFKIIKRSIHVNDTIHDRYMFPAPKPYIIISYRIINV